MFNAHALSLILSYDQKQLTITYINHWPLSLYAQSRITLLVPEPIKTISNPFATASVSNVHYVTFLGF